VPDEVLDDFSSDQIESVLNAPGFTERIKALAEGERLVIDPASDRRGGA
jgi:hypothetical protein